MMFFMNYHHYVLRPSLAQPKVYRNIYGISESLNSPYSLGDVKRGKYNKHRLELQSRVFLLHSEGRGNCQDQQVFNQNMNNTLIYRKMIPEVRK
jgi:hypothetical protein